MVKDRPTQNPSCKVYPEPLMGQIKLGANQKKFKKWPDDDLVTAVAVTPEARIHGCKC